jgi:hypothetical protein
MKIHPHIYETSHSELVSNVHPSLSFPPLKQIHLGGEIYHIAKSKVWNDDVYSYLRTTFKGTWRCETWIRGEHCEQNADLFDNKFVEWVNTETVVQYKSSQDHSKYAVI